MQHHPEQLLNYIKNQKDEFLALLKRLVETETPTSEPSQQEIILDLLAKELHELDFNINRIPGRDTGGQLLARPAWTNGEDCQLLIGHSDTVWPLQTLKEMPYMKNGTTVKGPGVFDMKAGLAMCILALRTIHHFNLSPPLSPVIFINSDEEEGSQESKEHMEMLARQADRTYVLEPSIENTGDLKTARKGFGKFEIRVRGRASHAGLSPSKGSNAILELSQILQKIYDLNDPERGISVNVGTIDGGIRSNVVAADSKASIDVRISDTEDAKSIEKTLYNLGTSRSDMDLKIKGGINRFPMNRTSRNMELLEKASRLGNQLGIKISHDATGGASAGNITSKYSATLDGLGAVGEGAHSYDEQIEIDRTLERCTLLTLLLMN